MTRRNFSKETRIKTDNNIQINTMDSRALQDYDQFYLLQVVTVTLNKVRHIVGKMINDATLKTSSPFNVHSRTPS